MRWSMVCLPWLVGCAAASANSGGDGQAGSAGTSVGIGGSATGGNQSGGSTGSHATGGTSSGGTSSGGTSSGGTSSGGTSSGGTAGTGGLPHIPGDCSGLAPVGQFEQITPPGVQLDRLDGRDVYGTQWILVNPQEPTMLFVGVDKQGFFKSTDCGSTWKKVNTGRNGVTIGTGAQWSAVMDPTNPNVIYAVNGYGSELGLWKTTDGGVDWDQLFPQGSEVANTVAYDFASIVSMDPTDHLHLVVSFHADCSGAYAPGCQAESKDGGATWRLLKAPGSGNWEGAGPAVIDANTWIYAMPFDGIWLTEDDGASWKNVTPAGANGSHYQLYHPEGGAYYLGSGPGVLMSTDGRAWTIVPKTGGSLAGLTGDGTTLFASQQNDSHYFTGPATGNWIEMPTPGRPAGSWGAYSLGYDLDHHILYASEQKGGLWRVVTR